MKKTINNTVPEKTSVVIIGAGFGGLSAAALLSRKGINVEIFESLSIAGGRARSVERDGFVLDFGIHGHRCANDGSAAHLMREIGEEVEWVPGDESRSLMIIEGERFKFPEGLGESLSLPFLGFGDRAWLLWLFGKIKLANPEKYRQKSFAAFVGKSCERPKLRRLLKAYCMGAMSPDIDTASASELLEIFQKVLASEHNLGVPVGGERQILNKLIERIEAPSHLNLGARVNKLHIEDGRVEFVETTRGAIKPRVVLFTAPVQRLFSVVDPDHFRPEFRKYARSLTPTAGISVELALARPVTDISESVVDLDNLLIGKFVSNSDHSLAPPDRQLATWLWVLDLPMLKDRKFMKGAKDAMRAKIEAIFPGTMKAVMWERWLYFPILDGVRLLVGQEWQDRHPLQSEDLKNLFFAGDTSRAPGVGGDIAFESALRVTPLIEKFLASEK